MAEGIIGTKIGMTRIFNKAGDSIPVTVVYLDKCQIIRKKEKEKDGYNAIIVGYSTKKREKATKPYTGIFKDLKLEQIPKLLCEFRLDNIDDYEIGKELDPTMFKAGDYIDVTSISKGKGFAGVMKRHGFGGLPASHGHGEYRRAPGSLSASSSPSRVFKGTKLPGHMGHEKVTIQKLEVIEINNDENYLLIKGAVPGPKKATLLIKRTVKSLKHKKEVKVQEEALHKRKR